MTSNRHPPESEAPPPVAGHAAPPAAGYAHMFPGPPPLALEDSSLAALARKMVEPAQRSENPDLPAGYTYFGQFIAHDLTRMRGQQNLSGARLRLDTVYGQPLENWRRLYKQNQAGDRVFVVGRGARLGGTATLEPDLPRKADGHPDIPDERDDFHFIVSQLHLAFMLLHNRLAKDLRENFPQENGERIFEAARRTACRTYQWLVVDDFLRRICDPSILAQVWPSPQAMNPDFRTYAATFERCLPYEFALAGFRFGHGLVRPHYKLNGALPRRPIFHPRGVTDWMADWRGHRKLPVEWSVQWNLFFDDAAATAQRACCLSTSIAPSLRELPKFAVADDPAREHLVNLAERTLRAGREAGLPSGQDAARHMLKNVFPKLGLRSFEVVDPEEHDPLWYYVLNEAARVAEGRRLGPVGSWIVATTIAGVLIGDEASFLHDAGWRPDLPREGERFELRDLIRYAGMPIGSRDWGRHVMGNLPAWC